MGTFKYLILHGNLEKFMDRSAATRELRIQKFIKHLFGLGGTKAQRRFS
jgi:hypothetical protein